MTRLNGLQPKNPEFVFELGRTMDLQGRSEQAAGLIAGITAPEGIGHAPAHLWMIRRRQGQNPGDAEVQAIEKQLVLLREDARLGMEAAVLLAELYLRTDRANFVVEEPKLREVALLVPRLHLLILQAAARRGLTAVERREAEELTRTFRRELELRPEDVDLPPKDTAPTTPVQERAVRTAQIIGRIRAADAKAFQAPPAAPTDNNYFGAAPFKLGPDQVMRFQAVPKSRSAEVPNVGDPNYLRTALVKRLRDHTAGSVVFDFNVRVLPADKIDPDVHIEDASVDWKESADTPFIRVASLTIPLQEFDTPEANLRCEQLVFNPWRGLEAHEPLGALIHRLFA